ncbi:hypothetical protein [Plantactinospora sp. KLBMP9567]|uniref:mevalonate kinase family protein n=1 Tax=Plantactinospora sp. KLBMP9567 TaxID=3085900 RepID=UPI002981152D|nr:hypothetical protein [Plantactinospora sp. KLBMP9567]MDW5324255.1 hypothetical protein [Plantactinospora sp. KLBMP9567]
MTGGPSVVAAVPLHTTVTVIGGDCVGPVLLASPASEPSTRAVDADDLGNFVGDGLDYLQAAVKVVMHRWPLLIKGARIEAASTVPVGAGVSSSAAVTVATAGALLRFADAAVPAAATVAQAAYDAETGQLGTGAGWMDFLACTHGGVCRIDAGDPPRVTRLAPSLGVPMLVIDTLQRRATPGVLASKRDRYRSGDHAMRAYAMSATAIVKDLTAVLRDPSPDHAVVGALMSEAQRLLRDLVGCSTPLIDECVRRCLASGAYGAKLTGSGYGGCLVALVPIEAIAAIHASLSDLPVRVMVFTTGEQHGVVFPPSDY